MIMKIPQDSSAPAGEVEDVLEGVQVPAHGRKRSLQILGAMPADGDKAVTIHLAVDAIAKQGRRERKRALPPFGGNPAILEGRDQGGRAEMPVADRPEHGLRHDVSRQSLHSHAAFLATSLRPNGSVCPASPCEGGPATRRRALPGVSVLPPSPDATPLPRRCPRPCTSPGAGALPARTRPCCDATSGCRQCGISRAPPHGAGLR